MYSMTGFGQGFISADGREFQVELKSVNHRFLDISMRLPRSLTFLETDIRNCISASLNRGHIDVFVNYKINRDDQYSVSVNEGLLKQYVDALEGIKDKYEVDTRLNLITLLRMPDVFDITEQDDDREEIKKLCVAACNQALCMLKEAREIEGKKLIKDISSRLGLIENSLKAVAERAPEVPEEYRRKLDQRIEEWLGKGEIDAQRLATEVALFADRCNIDEEIVRLNSHIDVFKKSINQAGIGRKLDFTLQEMNRETNTIGSKANDLTITGKVTEIKGELEKIREQIQNIE